MKYRLEAYCDHLNQEHAINFIGGQRSPAKVIFEAEKDFDIQEGSEGTCLSAGKECSHLCKKIILTRRSNNMAIDYEMNPIRILPTPPIEKPSA